MLAQFSSVAADTQQYVLADGEEQQPFILPSVQDQGISSDYVVPTPTEQAPELMEGIEITTVEDNSVFGQQIEQYQNANTETLHIIDQSTGETMVIVADKSVMALVKEAGCNLDKIKELASIAQVEESSLPPPVDAGQIDTNFKVKEEGQDIVYEAQQQHFDEDAVKMEEAEDISINEHVVSTDVSTALD